MGAPPKFDVAAAYEWHALYDDDNWSDDDVIRADAGDILKVPTSEFSRTVYGIFQGLHINSKGALGSALVEGRVPALWVTNLAEFQYATQALERAHSEKNKFAFNLLIAVRDIMGQAQRAKTRMALHKSITKQWRLPSWAPIKVYNPTMGKAEYSAMTKGQDCNQKIARLNKQTTTAGDAHQKLLHRVATELNLMVNRAPHPNLGNISSPRHEDHPEVWRHWVRAVTKTLPMGIVPTADGLPHQ